MGLGVLDEQEDVEDCRLRLEIHVALLMCKTAERALT
jgi:hypothetical protein